MKASCSRILFAGVSCLLACASALAQTGSAGSEMAMRVGAMPATIAQTGPSGIITTVAGDGYHGDYGNSGLAIDAQIISPSSVAADAAGDFYIADPYMNVVHKVSASTGKISIYAGVFGEAGYSGDKGPATSALLDSPLAVAVDSAGNLFIADSQNQLIRRVDAKTQIITTVAGNAQAAFQPHESPCISFTSGVAATSTCIYAPATVAVDSAGNIYIGIAQALIYKVTASTGLITEFAGIGQSGYSGDGGPANEAKLGSPQQLAVDSAGNLYIADEADCAIRMVNAKTSVITSLVGSPTEYGFGNCGYSGDGGPASAALLRYPCGVAVDASGNVFIADSDDQAIRMISVGDGNIYTIAGNGRLGETSPYGLPGYSGDGGPAYYGTLEFPEGLALDGLGNLYVADNENNVIREITAAAALPSQAPVISPPEMQNPDAINVTIACPVACGAIYYTTDGTVPSTNSKKYTGPIPSFTTGTVAAFATIPGKLNTTLNFGTYFFAPAPTFPSTASPMVITKPTTITIADANSAAKIYYTVNNLEGLNLTDGTLYTGPITISNSAYIVAGVYVTAKSLGGTASGWSPWTTLDIIYAPAPVITPGSEAITKATQVTITDTNSKAAIYYTTDGSDPTQIGPTVMTYSGPITISGTTTLKAAAYANDLGGRYAWSAIATATYTMGSAPTVTTVAASALTSSGATLNGAVTANSATTQYWFAYGTSSSSLTSTTTHTGSLTGTASTSISAAITGLTSKKTYYFQAVASNANGTTKGAVLNFTTK